MVVSIPPTSSLSTAHLCLFFRVNGDIDGAKKHLGLFCKKKDTAKQYAKKRTPIVAAFQSVEGNEEEREFLLSWVNVIDYE